MTHLIAPKGKIIVQIVPTKVKKSLIIRVEEKEERYVQAKVIDFGADLDFIDTDELVLIDRYSGHHVKVDEVEYIILKQDEVLAFVERQYDLNNDTRDTVAMESAVCGE